MTSYPHIKINYTKEEPGCYHSMIKYLAEMENTTVYKTIIFKMLADLYEGNGKKPKLKYKSHKIQAMVNGRLIPFVNQGHRVIGSEYHVTIMKSLNDFTTKPISSGTYNDSLGGGWSSNVALYKINDNYFAMMECTCN